jgi:TolB protein
VASFGSSFSGCLSRAGAETPVGIFEDHADIGTVLQAGAAEYDPAKQADTVSGSGENMWLQVDAFHFLWKRVSGDVMLTADISFIGAGGNPHRKVC